MKSYQDFEEDERLKNAFWAAGTGVIMGALAVHFSGFFVQYEEPPPFHLGSLIGAAVGFGVYMAYSVPLMDKTKTLFSYQAYLREKSTRKFITSVLSKSKGFKGYLLRTDELFRGKLLSDDIYKKVLLDNDVVTDDNKKFLIYYRISKDALKYDNRDKERSYLKKAVMIKPNDLLANYRLALSYERSGEGSDAIKSYEAALKDPLADPHISGFLISEIQRVKGQGPRKTGFWGVRFLIE